MPWILMFSPSSLVLTLREIYQGLVESIKHALYVSPPLKGLSVLFSGSNTGEAREISVQNRICKGNSGNTREKGDF